MWYVGYGAWGVGHGAWGMGHGMWGMGCVWHVGNGVWGVGRGACVGPRPVSSSHVGKVGPDSDDRTLQRRAAETASTSPCAPCKFFCVWSEIFCEREKKDSLHDLPLLSQCCSLSQQLASLAAAIKESTEKHGETNRSTRLKFKRLHVFALLVKRHTPANWLCMCFYVLSFHPQSPQSPRGVFASRDEARDGRL